MKFDEKIQLIIVGESSVGKTSLLYKYYLPDIDKFYSRLSDSKCDINDYKHAQNVFNKFGCRSLLDYHNIYLKSDVLLLSDIWDNFRKVCFKNYGLDTCYYYTAPGLSFDSMLKITTCKIFFVKHWFLCFS